jgi:hypothetical protein
MACRVGAGRMGNRFADIAANPFVTLFPGRY